jgi:hypothetical protein
MFKSYICPLLSFFTYPIGDGGFKGFNNVISSAKIAILFHTAKGLAEKMAVERLQGCKAANCMTFFFDGEMRRVRKILYNIYITN